LKRGRASDPETKTQNRRNAKGGEEGEEEREVEFEKCDDFSLSLSLSLC
jgi:hypothetical protein